MTAVIGDGFNQSMQHIDYRLGGSSVANKAGFRIDSWNGRLSKLVNRLHEIFTCHCMLQEACVPEGTSRTTYELSA